MDQIETIRSVILPIVEEFQVKLYDVKWVQQKRDKILQLSIMNSDGSMDIETCTLVSEKVSATLDEKDFIPFEYFLEVCSPGAEREILDYSEFFELIGKHVYVRVKKPIKKMLEFTGDVLEVTDIEMTMNYRDKSLTKKVMIEKENIDTCRLAVKL